jgi:hypothetical protein
MTARKIPPFEGTPPDFETEDGLRIWLTQPLGMVTQVDSGRKLSERMTSVMIGPAYDRLHRIAGDDHPFFFIHDFADIDSFEPVARNALVMWPRSIGRANIGKMIVRLSPETSAVFQMTVRLGASAIAMAGFDVGITTDPLPQVVEASQLRHLT